MKFGFIIFLVITTICKGQQYPYRNLIFEGAGIKSIAYVGVLEEFEKVGILKNINKVGGTSSGALTALLISIGYNAKEIKDITFNTRINKFNDAGFPFFSGFHRLKKNYGWFRGDRLSRWIGNLISTKTNDPDITFSQLHDKGFKDLYITATCLNKQKLIVLSYKTYPNMKVRDAVRISTSIPLYFRPLIIDSSGTEIKKPGKRRDLDMVMDGGIIGNYPIELFDSIVPGLTSSVRIINPLTLGIRIDSEKQIINDKLTKELVPMDIGNIKDYMQAFYIFILENLNRTKLNPDDWHRTLSIPEVDIGSKIKNLSSDQKNALISSGRKSAIEFLTLTKY